MNNNENLTESGGKDIQKRIFSFACRIVKLYQFLVKQRDGMEVLVGRFYALEHR